MKKTYCIVCAKHRQIKKPKISDIFKKALVLSIICSKCKKSRRKNI